MPGAGYYGIAARGAGITVLRCAMPGAGYYGIVARDAPAPGIANAQCQSVALSIYRRI